jgi:hypothetical protein
VKIGHAVGRGVIYHHLCHKLVKPFRRFDDVRIVVPVGTHCLHKDPAADPGRYEVGRQHVD